MERDFLSLVHLGKLKETGPKNILFVDDVCDTGKTVTEIRSQVPNGRWAVLYSKTDNMGIDFIGKRVYNVNKWIVFPWEKQ
jgi:hypoxanthine phosphoribosyltransferase